MSIMPSTTTSNSKRHYGEQYFASTRRGRPVNSSSSSSSKVIILKSQTKLPSPENNSHRNHSRRSSVVMLAPTAPAPSRPAAFVSSFLLAASTSSGVVSSLSLSSASKQFLTVAENQSLSDYADADGSGSDRDGGNNNGTAPRHRYTSFFVVQDDGRILITVDLFEIMCACLFTSLWVYIVCRFYNAWRKYACVHDTPARFPKSPSLLAANMTSLAAARRFKKAAQAKVAGLLVSFSKQSSVVSECNNKGAPGEVSDSTLSSITAATMKQQTINSTTTMARGDNSPSCSSQQQQRRVRWQQQEKHKPSLIAENDEQDFDSSSSSYSLNKRPGSKWSFLTANCRTDETTTQPR